MITEHVQIFFLHGLNLGHYDNLVLEQNEVYTQRTFNEI